MDSSLLNLEESSSPDNFFKPVQILNISFAFLMNNSTAHQVFESHPLSSLSPPALNLFLVASITFQLYYIICLFTLCLHELSHCACFVHGYISST